jgi:hypothetical protein
MKVKLNKKNRVKSKIDFFLIFVLIFDYSSESNLEIIFSKFLLCYVIRQFVSANNINFFDTLGSFIKKFENQTFWITEQN